MTQQRQLDFSRAEQLALIRDAELPLCNVAGARVSPAKLKLVLRTLDDYCRGGEGWPTQATLARSANVSRRTLQRCLTALEELGLLIVDLRLEPTTDKVCNHYRIVWSELAVRGPPMRHGDAERGPPMRQGDADRCVTLTDRCVTLTDRCATDGASIRKRPEAQRNDPGPGPGREGREQESWRDFCARSPALQRASQTVIPPAAPELSTSLRWSVFKGLRESQLQNVGQMVLWWRCQLNAESPISGNCKAELLLVLAAARRASRMPLTQIRESRLAVFKGLVTKCAWQRVLPYVDEVADEVDAALDDVHKFFCSAESQT